MVNNWPRYVLAVADLTLWAGDVLADEGHATDAELNRSMAEIVLAVPEFNALHPWAERVIDNADLAADQDYNQYAADLVITFKVHLPPGRLEFEERGSSEPVSGGDIGGDVQDADSLKRRFAAKLGVDEWAVVDVAFYLGFAGVEREGDLYLYRQDEFFICTDPDRPGDTEVRPGDQRDYRLDLTAPCQDDVYDHCADLPLSAVLFLPELMPQAEESTTDAA